MLDVANARPAEKILLAKTVEGLEANLFDGPIQGVSEGAHWGEERVVRGSFIRDLCIEDGARVGPRGVQLRGARIVGELDLMFAKLDHPLSLQHCYFEKLLNVEQAHFPALTLTGSHLPGIGGSRLKVEGDLLLDLGFACSGAVLLNDARVGSLSCAGAWLNNPSGRALLADRISVDGTTVLAYGFRADGEVRLPGAKLGALVCRNGRFINPQRPTLVADGITVAGDVALDLGFRSVGELRLLGARLVDLVCSGGRFINPNGIALNADRITVEGTAFLDGDFKARGTVRLVSGRLGSLICTGGKFKKSGSRALSADGISIERGAFLTSGFIAEGEVAFVAANIGGQLACTAGQFINPRGNAFSGDGMAISGGAFLDGCQAMGEVRFVGARLSGPLICIAAMLSNPPGTALSMENAAVEGHVFLNGVTSVGLVNLLGASVSGTLTCRGGAFYGLPRAFDGERMHVTGPFDWSPREQPGGHVDLADAIVGELRDNLGVWPRDASNLNIDGFVYGTLDSPGSATDRLRWLHKYCFGERYAPQPYEQMANIYREAGHENDAREISVGREDARKETLPRWKRPGHALFRGVVGYGYQLWWAMSPLVLLVAVGAILFAFAHAGCETSYERARCEMTPTTALSELPDFQPLVYALDTVLPIVDLRQQEFWTPDGAYRWPFWILIAMGWVLTTTVVGGLSRVLARR